jgi:hypothetical protein
MSNLTTQTSTSINSSASSGIALQLASSGADTMLTGVTVEGKQVTANVGGNLNIESLQDTATYAEKNSQVGASGMIGVGTMSGSANYAKSNINSNYASVTEQSGIKAGDGGFTVNVQGNTALVGGAITSTQAAVDQNKNSFKTGGNITLDGHSRGGMTVGNALTAVQEQGGAGGGKTNVNLYGSAYNAQDAANTVNQLTNGQGQVKQSTNNYDFIGRILGGNAGTGGTIPEGSSVLEEVIKTMGGNSTVHNNYGDGKNQKGIDDYWDCAKPVLQPVTPTNVSPAFPTGEGK